MPATLAIARAAEGEEHAEVRVGGDLENAFRREASELPGPKVSLPKARFEELELAPDSLPEGRRLPEKEFLDCVVDKDRGHGTL